jgi:hypothetical protein
MLMAGAPEWRKMAWDIFVIRLNGFGTGHFVKMPD